MSDKSYVKEVVIGALILIITSLILTIVTQEVNIFPSWFFENLFIGLFTLTGALIGVIGTLIVQFTMRNLDKEMIERQEINKLKGRLDILLRKLDFSLTLDDSSNHDDLKKDQAARILKNNFVKLGVYSELINKLVECEEYFVDNSKFKSVQKVNDNLWQILIFIHQISLPEEIENEDQGRIAYKHNIRMYESIKEMCEELEIIKEKL